MEIQERQQFVWSEIRGYLEREFQRCMSLWLDARDDRTANVLQGEAKAYRRLLGLPQVLAIEERQKREEAP